MIFYLGSQSGSKGSEQLWAEHGLTGLVIFSLLGLIFYIVRQGNVTTKKILDDERSERKYTTDKHVQATDKLANAIDKLSESWSKK